MRDSAKVRTQLMRDEGLRLEPYRDTTGHLTIGFGRNLDAVGISADEAAVLLDNDITRTYSELVASLPWVESLDDARVGALVNLTFNLGLGGLLGFLRMLRALQEQDWHAAAEELLDSEYAGQVGDRARRLARQIERGEWQ